MRLALAGARTVPLVVTAVLLLPLILLGTVPPVLLGLGRSRAARVVAVAVLLTR